MNWRKTINSRFEFSIIKEEVQRDLEDKFLAKSKLKAYDSKEKIVSQDWLNDIISRVPIDKPELNNVDQILAHLTEK